MRLTEVNVPRLVISAPQGKTGKTLVTVTLILKLIERGLRVQVFKVGPDFIDPTYHSAASGRPCRNLDMYLHGPEKVLERFIRYSQDADLCIIEGVFGLYDSVDGLSEFGCTAQIAKILRAPVILVLNAERATRSLVAIVRGLRNFDNLVNIRGVILTNVSSDKHYKKIEKAFKMYCKDIEVLGYIKRCSIIEELFKYRHLGLVPVPERLTYSQFEILKEFANIDVDRVIEIASSAQPLRGYFEEIGNIEKYEVSIGIVQGRAFTFYYPEVIEQCFSLSSKVYIIDPETCQELPNIDILIIGGGFPEELAANLEKNKSLRKSIRKFAEEGGVIYAECGGLMYLTSKLLTLRNEEYDMCDVYEAYTVMLSRPVGHGYVYGVVNIDTPAYRAGIRLRGHEFHHSKILLRDSEVKIVMRLLRGRGLGDGTDGLLKWNAYAQYMHVHPDTFNYVHSLISYVVRKKGCGTIGRADRS